MVGFRTVLYTIVYFFILSIVIIVGFGDPANINNTMLGLIGAAIPFLAAYAAWRDTRRKLITPEF